MARKKNIDRPVEWKVSIPTSTAAKVELCLYDAVRGRARYASRSKLITRLLNDWLESRPPRSFT